MEKVKITLNGKVIQAQEGMTILEIARNNGVEIPTLCYLDNLPPVGACRLCVVEVEGVKNLVGSCHTPVQKDMVIYTHSSQVLAARKIILELLLSSHSGDCLVCDNANTCDLRQLAGEAGVTVSRFRAKKRFYPLEDACPWMFRDLSKCILCYRCIWACRHLAKQNLLSVGYRGFANKIISDSDNPLCKQPCETCQECIQVCPTQALLKPEQRFAKRKQAPLIIK